jgi:hypothetical protein
VKTTQQYVTWSFLFPLFPSPPFPRKTIHNLPKTPPHQDYLITNGLTQGQIPWSVPIYESSSINCADLTEDSYPRRIRDHVLAPVTVKNTNLKPSWHRTGTTTVVCSPQEFDYVSHQESNPTKMIRGSFPHTKHNPTCDRTMGQDYPFNRPSPGVNPTIYPSFLVLTWRGLPPPPLFEAWETQKPLIFKSH